MAAALLLLVALFSCAPAYAQSGTGEIWGRVAEMTGEAVDRATVTVTHTDASGAGRYAVPPGTSLSPGDTVLVGERWF